MRGPLSLPGPYSPGRPPVDAGKAARFDGIVLDCVEQLERRLGDRLDAVDFAVEDVPAVIPGPGEQPPLATTLTSPPGADGGTPAYRMLVHRRPIEVRARSRADIEDLVLDVLVGELTVVLGLDPGAIDPRPAEED